MHAKAAATGAPALPIVLCHGWPDSFWRYLKVIPLLTDPGAHGGDPADAFDVVVPDMPGFGYSDRPTGAAPDSVAVAGLWAELMSCLGHERFGVAGGDIGSGVARFLALDHPDRVVAVHRMDAGIPCRRSAVGGSRRGRAGVPRLCRGVVGDGGSVCRDAPHPCPDGRRRTHRLTSGARGVGRGEDAGVERRWR